MGHGTSHCSHVQLLYRILLCILVSATAANKYVWKTGRWHECQHYQCGKGGTQIRSVFCGERDNNFKEVDASNCQYLQKPESRRSCFKVCAHHRKLLRWAENEWSDCELSPEYRECSIKHGIRFRNVTCVWKTNGFVEDESVCLEFMPKPETRSSCTLKCPQDCVVSSFSSWNYCDTCLIVNRTRTRALIVPPSNGGNPCPALTEMIPCDNCTETYTYKIGPWGKCKQFDQYMQIHETIHPYLGYQTRDIECIDSKGNSLPNYQPCLEYLRSKDTELLDKQTCIIPQDCQLDRYSDATRLPGLMIKTRRIVKVPLGIGKPCPPLVQVIPVKSTDQQPRYEWKMSNWSRCKTPSGGYPCTTGLQTRQAICIQKDADGREKPTDNSYCPERHPLTAQICRAQCDIDCVVSQWAEWSECKVTDCELYLRRRRNNEGTGQRHRTRKIRIASHGEGQRCLHLSETQMCDPQPCYQWNITVGECRLLHPNMSPECGLGKAYRTLTCINKLGAKKPKKKKNKNRPKWRFRPYMGFADDKDDDRDDTEQLRVADVKCEELQERPHEEEDCSVPCPNDCILSPWSPWSPCPNLCQEGKSRAAQQTRERTILALPGQGGASCPPNRDLQDVRICPTTIECAIYVWQTDPWGVCRINDPKNSCGPGRQTRDVNCYSLGGQLASDQRCTLEVKPKGYQACTVACPVDCQVTEYSDWSQCSSSCWEAKQTIPVMTRVRYIIEEPKNGGSPCPIKLQEVRQCTNLTLCQKFYWDTRTWSRCVLPLHKIPHCGRGLQARDIFCKFENGTSQPLDVCIREIGPMPQVSRECYLSCDEECRFEEWSEWSKCINGCNGNRFRTRKLIEGDDVNIRCKDHRLYSKDSFEKCLCDVHRAVPIGNQSECILESDDEFYKSFRTFQGYTLEGERTSQEPTRFRPSASLGVNAVCGEGKRYKVLACQNDKGEVEAANTCTLKPYEEERCLIACPVDCVMSEWALWTDCSTSCGTGIQSRYREIKQIPSDGGRACPNLDDTGKDIQTRICISQCRQYIWKTLKWSPCMPYRTYASCGNGTQSRNVRCVKVIAEGFKFEDVGDTMCSHMSKLPDTQTCVAPCAGQCVVSDWMEWSRCQQPCSNPNQVQTRTRLILRHPSSDPRNTCPSTLEERFCIRGQNCLEYRWVMSDWTTCLINSGRDECGIGHKYRFPLCYDQLNNEIDPETCKEVIGESKSSTTMSCEVGCNIDCLLTEWSPWSTCSSTCGLGNQERRRNIVQSHKGNGRPCPEVHVQEKPCFQRGCYTWNVSPWSPCINQKGICGYGIQERNISCIADGGLVVNGSNCEPDLNIVVLERERSCVVPCPGECVMSDWSEWNDCFLDCKDYSRKDFTRGVQTRSRAVLAYAQPKQIPCPEQLWESRPCEVSKCYTFDWKTSGWTPQRTQTIWCERSDGLLVQGGCSEHSKPPSTLSCNPPCSVPHSVCNNTNVCVCGPKYKPFYNRLGVLITCTKMDNSTETNPTHKSVTLPTDGPTNVWMYAVIAAGTLFVIFLAVACYTMSEFFHKGPRPRKKEEEKSIEGAENVEGMVAETEFASCNHVAPVAAISELDTQSVISVDRTPPQSVRAQACNGNAGMHFQKTIPATNPDSIRVGRGTDAPDYVGQHFSVLLHDSNKSSDCDNVWKMHANKHLDNCSLNLHENLDLDKENLERGLHELPLNRAEPQTNCKVSNVQELTRSGPVPTSLYAEVDKKGNVTSSVTIGAHANRRRGNTDSNPADRLPKQKLKYKKEKPFQVHNNLNGKECADVKHSSTYKQTEASKFLAMTNRSSGEFAMHPEEDIVYLNREASDSEDDCKTGKSDRNSLSLNNFLQTVLEKIDNITSDSKSPTNNDSHEPFPEIEDVDMESVSEVECEPLLGKTANLNDNSTGRFPVKSNSMEVKQMLDSDDDCVSRTHSLRSHISSRSRTSHLSFSMGPVIKIDPEDSKVYDFNRNSLPKSLYCNSYSSSLLPPQRATLPKQHMNVGYISLSSIDTEPSTAPSSSVSCDSLSPRSLPSESLSETLAVDNMQIRGVDMGSEKSASRNVALGSLKNAYNAKKLKNLDHEIYKDSGVGSIGMNADNISDKTGSTSVSIKSYKGDERMPEDHSIDSRGKPQSNDLNNSIEYSLENSHQNRFHGNGNTNDGNVTSSLLTPLHFLNLKSKRETLVKQTCSDDLDCSQV